MKKTIKLSEDKFHNLIKESVKRILRENNMKLNEYGDTPKGQYMLGRLQARKGSETWAPSWEASEERDNAATKAEKQGKSYNITHNNMLRAYRDGKNGVQWNESLNRLIKESVKSVLREVFEKPSNWTDTPWKGTYQDETGALYMPDDDFEDFEDEPGYYKGYHLEMDNNDPSFPHYQIISPNGEPCGGAWTFTDMQEYVDGLGQ